MTKQEVIDRIVAHRLELQDQGVKSLALFGSLAREQAQEASDVDVVVELNRQMGLFGLSDLKALIETILGVRKVDLIVRDGIHPALKDAILRDAVDVI
jgi:predicted nucleotidyltransferase